MSYHGNDGTIFKYFKNDKTKIQIFPHIEFNTKNNNDKNIANMRTKNDDRSNPSFLQPRYILQNKDQIKIKLDCFNHKVFFYIKKYMPTHTNINMHTKKIENSSVDDDDTNEEKKTEHMSDDDTQTHIQIQNQNQNSNSNPNDNRQPTFKLNELWNQPNLTPIIQNNTSASNQSQTTQQAQQQPQLHEPPTILQNEPKKKITTKYTSNTN